MEFKGSLGSTEKHNQQIKGGERKEGMEEGEEGEPKWDRLVLSSETEALSVLFKRPSRTY